MSDHKQLAGFQFSIMTVLQKWMKYILLYSIVILLLATFYVSWDKTHSPSVRVIGTHVRQPLHKTRLLELARDISETYINVETGTHFAHHCSDCALVVSSGQLLDKAAGKEIDNASCVIRMNDAPTLGYSVDVGHKTTLRVVCFKSLPFIQDSLLIGRGKTDMVAVWGANNPGHKGRVSYLQRRMLDAYGHAPVQFYSMQDKGEKMVERVFQDELGIDRVRTNTWISTGVFTMILAVQMCNRITVYGMVDENYCRLHPNTFIPFHYYGRSMLECEMYKKHQEELEDGSHRFLSEKTMYRRWANMLNIKFRYPTWNFTAPGSGRTEVMPPLS